MGGTMIPHQAERGGAAAMIPGAFEIRTPTARPAQAGARSAPHPQAAAASDRERLEHEREGGGAPGERGGRAGTIGRLWRTLRHPMQLQV